MEFANVKCTNCGQDIYLLEEFVRKEIFCTIDCLEKYRKNSGGQTMIN